MGLDRETTYELAQAKGYTGDKDIYQIREWLWSQGKVFVGIGNIVRDHTLGFKYTITDYRLDKVISTSGDDVWVSLETALIQGLQKALIDYHS